MILAAFIADAGFSPSAKLDEHCLPPTLTYLPRRNVWRRDGVKRASVVLLVANAYLEGELERVLEMVSPGYSRRRVRIAAAS